jgi:predicted transposase YdaD
LDNIVRPFLGVGGWEGGRKEGRKEGKKEGRKEGERKKKSPVWWCIPIILALERWKQEDQEFKVIMTYIARSRLVWRI